VSVGTDREVKTRRLREMRWDVSRCEDGKERGACKCDSNPNCSLVAPPEMPLKRHLPHLTTNDGSTKILVTLLFFMFSVPEDDVILESCDGRRDARASQ